MSKSNELRINREIKESEVRLIAADGEQLGIVSLNDAIAKAAEADLDLVEISPTAKPPVCKVLDYGKYRFEQKKKKKEAEKRSRETRSETKEIWLRPNIDTHDVETKLRHAKDFLAKGDKVRFTVKFRGRELSHKEKGAELLGNVLEKLDDLCTVDQSIKQNGRQMFMVVAPATKKE